MEELKRTQLYDCHLSAGATMVDFGGWEMPVQYPGGILEEHLYTRRFCSLFDVSHMGRLLIKGPDMLPFLLHVLTSNPAGLEVGKAQYCMIPDPDGGAVDDAYLYRYAEGWYLLVVNASNAEKDKTWLNGQLTGFDCTIEDISEKYAAIAVQGPESNTVLMKLSPEFEPVTCLRKNGLAVVTACGRTFYAAQTGYTGEPVGYELYTASKDAGWLWNSLIELGARPAGLGARDTLRLEAGYPLYGHEMGVDPDGNRMPIFAVPAARFAVSFAPEKGDFIGEKELKQQADAYQKILKGDSSDCAALPKRVRTVTLLDRGVMRAGMAVYANGKPVGWITSGTMVPYWHVETDGTFGTLFPETGKRAIGLAYLDSDIAEDQIVEVDIRGKRLRAAVVRCHLRADAMPYARPVLYTMHTEK